MMIKSMRPDWRFGRGPAPRVRRVKAPPPAPAQAAPAHGEGCARSRPCAPPRGVDALGVEVADRPRRIARHVAGELQRQIAAAADAQERREIVDLPVRLDQLLVQLGEQLRHVHAVAPRDVLEHAPVEVLEPDAGRITAHPHRFQARAPQPRIRADKEPAHQHVLRR